MIEKLDEILHIENKEERQQALTEYASSLKVNTAEVYKDGQLDEDKLIVHIYSAEIARKSKKDQLVGMAVASLILITLLLAIIFVYVNFMLPAS